eukprot:CAMPEP_0113566400 /NCGR_PEP_ID=MMETSP0015_2-20120614/22700_1 /TAXON_ID=2838 /ORGANISM="Odontella" /LENGTH=345 /DNA_ID=CAMNT_0000468681 /DNA_START=79 /DNA_END=1116 /DNA_ORIENTATION=- /assembly_acc=CAM_ASM_000160
MSTSPVKEISSAPPLGRKSVLFFWASWHEQSNTGGAIDAVFGSLASAASAEVDFYRIEAESQPQLSLKYGVTIVPTFILLDASGSVVDRVDGGDDVPLLTQAVSGLSSRSSAGQSKLKQQDSSEAATANEKEVLNERLKSLINSSDVMLFMKGSPAAPRCGFSRQTVELLSDANLLFGTFDILTDEQVRQGLKTYSDWPTYPQLYVKGDLVGGLDIMKEMAEDGDLAGQLGVNSRDVVHDSNTQKSLEDRLKDLVNKERIMLFMKGLPSAPRCGFSRQIVEMLNNHGASYEAFDILTDEEVRQALKKYSDWPTYPQLYVDGDLVGGLDIVREMDEGGDLKDLLMG